MVLRHPAPRRRAAVTFRDRDEAARRLLAVLRECGVAADLVLGVVRGGVPVAAVVAEGLGLPLDALVARKVGVPGQEELALGAVTRFGAAWNDALLAELHLPPARLDAARDAALAEVEHREARYHGDHPPRPIAGQRVLVVDDGIATGATIAAAVQSIQRAGAAAVLVAVPVAPPDAVDRIERLGAQIVTVATPVLFGAVGAFYVDFSPVSDDRCIEILERGRHPGPR